MRNPQVELVVRGVTALRRSTIWWAFGVGCFAVVNVAFWPSFEGTDALSSLEESSGDLLKAFGGENIATPAGYLDGQLFAVMLPLLMAGMAITMVSALTSGDEDAGRLELLHALPVSRRAIWLARFLAATSMVLAVGAVTFALVVASRPIFSLDDVGSARLLGATFACAVLGVFHGAVVYLLGATGHSRPVSVGWTVLVLVLGYVVNFVFVLSDGLDGLRPVSPWYWAVGDQPVSNGVEPLWLGLTGVALVGLVAAGTVGLQRRDIRSV